MPGLPSESGRGEATGQSDHADGDHHRLPPALAIPRAITFVAMGGTACGYYA
jgi:hypothetical protein